MSVWEEGLFDEGEEGYFEFNDENTGKFHFGYVDGHMNCRRTTRDGVPAVEWSWDGRDELDSAQGRGWAIVKGDELHGMVFFQGGNESQFLAKKMRGEQTKARKGKR